jgi:hypothetical protein
MRGLASGREGECAHVYTTRPACVAPQTRPAIGVSTLQELNRRTVGRTIAELMLDLGGCDTRNSPRRMRSAAFAVLS